eukprot:scaffold368_cov258-Pinguiococcus_pyrenoidosus.AAC.3
MALSKVARNRGRLLRRTFPLAPPRWQRRALLLLLQRPCRQAPLGPQRPGRVGDARDEGNAFARQANAAMLGSVHRWPSNPTNESQRFRRRQRWESSSSSPEKKRDRKRRRAPPFEDRRGCCAGDDHNEVIQREALAPGKPLPVQREVGAEVTACAAERWPAEIGIDAFYFLSLGLSSILLGVRRVYIAVEARRASRRLGWLHLNLSDVGSGRCRRI